jgi:enamine deaminase RidA (YjgF/YER057c/UK114 family)
LQCLAALDQALGGLDRIERLIKVTGYVACTAGFTALPAVIDAASECFVEMLGAAGAHARSSIGVHQLPRGAPVEVELVAALREVS